MGELKNRRTLSSTLDKKLYAKLDDLVRDTRVNKSKYIDEAIEDLLKKYGIELNIEKEE